MAVADKPILLPSRFEALQSTIDGIQREILIPMEVLSQNPDGYAIVRITLENHADDAAAAAAGVPVGALYRTGSAIKMRVS